MGAATLDAKTGNPDLARLTLSGFEPVNVSSAMMTAAPPATEPAPLNDTPETHPLPKTIQIVSKRDRPRIPQPNFRLGLFLFSQSPQHAMR
jgi:hypothetical protein